MSEASERFLESNNIDLKGLNRKHKLSSNPSRDNLPPLSYNLSYQEINPIIARYSFEKNVGVKNISVADIVGYSIYQIPYGKGITLEDALAYYFGENGTGYQTRSLSMLKLNENNVIEELGPSFKREPITVRETGEGPYNIHSNGMHRYLVLRLLYLKELREAGDDQEKINALREKYTIPVEVTEMELNKTYCNYLMSMARRYEINPERRFKSLYAEYVPNQNQRKTGNIVITYPDKRVIVVSEKELIEMTRREVIDKDLITERTDDVLKKKVREEFDTYKSFTAFVNNTLLDVKLDKPYRYKETEREDYE